MAYINCKDGFEFSMQYCSREPSGIYCELDSRVASTALKVTHMRPLPLKVEIREDSMEVEFRDKVLEEYLSEHDDRVFPYVPMQVVYDLIERHGGIDHKAETFIRLFDLYHYK
jgi:hypothetical protein